MEERFARHEYVSEGEEKDVLYSRFSEPVRKWLEESISSLNSLQLISVPLILDHKSTLILAPTGSGKTLASFLGLIDELTKRAIAGVLEDRIYAMYVSPLRALNNDIHKNLQLPLHGMVKYMPEGISPVRSAVRTGDTTSYERSKMLKRPPHILITTPESLGIILASKKFSQHLRTVEWLLIDEIHALASDKRGVFLSLMVEWLEIHAERPPIRIGLSATISPIDKIANFLMGCHSDDRVVHIIDYGTVKKLDLEIITPSSKMGNTFSSSTLPDHIDILSKLLDDYQTSIIFANTRNWSERVGRDLIAKDIKLTDKVAVHHSSVDRELRFEIEDRMKRGELKAIITSASLELGIDVGSIDLAVQMNSPKSVNRALQRFGRAGHFFMSVSRGKFLVSSLDELLEISAIARLCLEGELDEIYIPSNAEDVLAQFIVGLTIDRNWTVEEIHEIITRSFNYYTYDIQKLGKLINSMSNPLNPDENWKYGRIWFDESSSIVSRKSYQRQNFMMNIGTIPDTSSVDVVLESTRDKIGRLTERFVENLSAGSVFVLGGRTFLYLRTVGNKIIVREAFNALPTVPSWWGEAMGRSLNVSYEIGRMLERFEEVFSRREDDDDKIKYLNKYYHENYPLNEQDSMTLVKFIHDQYKSSGLPTRTRMIVEKYVDPAGRTIIIVLSIYGLRVNIPLAQAYAKAMTEQIGTNVGFTATDNGFSLILPIGSDFEQKEVLRLMRTSDQFYTLLSRALEDTEIFKTRFRYTAVRGLMVLKNSPRRKLSPDLVQRSAQKLMRELPEDFPLIQETKREIYEDVYDASTASEVIIGINSNLIEQVISEGEVSSFSHSIILASVADIVLNDDRQRLMMDLHQQMINKLRKNNDILFDPSIIQKYFESKLRDANRYQDEDRLQNFIIRSPADLESLISKGSEITGLDPDYIVSILEKSKVILKLNSSFWHRDILLVELYKRNVDITMIEGFRRSLKDDEVAELQEMVLTVPPVKLLENAMIRYLSVVGPRTIRELQDMFEVEEVLIREAIYALQRTDVILAGEFTEDSRQYMLNNDRLVLSDTEEESDVFTLNQLTHLRMRVQHFSNKLDLNFAENIRRIGPVRHVADVMNRSRFSWTNLRMALDTEEVFYGRFFAGKAVFVHESLVPLLIGIYRKVISLDEDTRSVLDYFKYRDAVRYSDLMYAFEFPAEQVREHLKLLEQEMYICRIGWNLSTSYAQTNIIYKEVPFEWHEPEDSDFDHFVTLVLQWYGPLTIENLQKITKIEYSSLERSLRRLEIESRHVFSKEYLYFGLPEHFAEMEDIPREREFSDEISALSSFDPFINTSGSVFNSLMMTPDTYRLLYKGKIIGSLITTPKVDYLEVTNVIIPPYLRDDPSFISNLASTLFKLSKTIYSMNFVMIEEIRSSPPNFQENDIFTIVMSNNGFTLEIDHLVGGMTNTSSIGMHDIIEVKLQNIITYFKKTSVDELIRDLGKFTIDKLLLLADSSLVELKLKLSRELKQGGLWFKNGYYYTDEYWNLLKEDMVGLTENEENLLRLLEKSQMTQYEIARALRQTDTSVGETILSLKGRNLIDPVNPDDRVVIWRRSSRSEVKDIDLMHKLYSSIRIHGPISFTELLEHHSELSNFSKTFVLLNLAKLLEERKIESIWLGEKQRQVFYYCPKLTEVFENPSRSSNLPEWMLAHSKDLPMKELLGISNLYFSSLTHALFKKGSIVATLTMEFTDDALVVKSLRLVPDLSEEDLLGIAQQLEEHMSKNGREDIVIERIFNQTIDYWRS